MSYRSFIIHNKKRTFIMFQGSKKGVRGVTWWFKTIKTIILTWYWARVKISINVLEKFSFLTFLCQKFWWFQRLVSYSFFGDFNASKSRIWKFSFCVCLKRALFNESFIQNLIQSQFGEYNQNSLTFVFLRKSSLTELMTKQWCEE